MGATYVAQISICPKRVKNNSIAESEKTISIAKYDSDTDVMNDYIDSEVDLSCDEENNIVKRICYCDMITLPLDYIDCN